MVGLTLAIGDFMVLLVTSVLWVGAGFAGVAAGVLVMIGGGWLLARHLWRGH